MLRRLFGVFVVACAFGSAACAVDNLDGDALGASVEQDDCDCRVTGCPAGQSCSFCWGGFACLPSGAVCFAGGGGQGDDGSELGGDGFGDGLSGGGGSGPIEQGGPGGGGGGGGSCGGGGDDPPPDDCRSTGCGDGQYCTFCWVGYACIPDGAVC